MSMSIYMPQFLGEPFYPGGFPLNFKTENWQGNVKEQLLEATRRYYNFHSGDEPFPTRAETKLLIDFLIYFINAPIWMMNPYNVEPIKALIKRADKMITLEHVDEFINECLDAGLDPL